MSDPPPARRRVFFAARPGDDERMRVHACLAAHPYPPEIERRLRWLDASGWHVTLRFVGDVDAALVPALLRGIGAMQPFTIQFQAIEPFPSPKRPLVLATTGIAEAPGHEVVDTLEAHCQALALPGERRRWRPHMSLARVRGRGTLHCPALPLTLNMRVDEYLLMESLPGPAGMRYVPITSGA